MGRTLVTSRRKAFGVFHRALPLAAILCELRYGIRFPFTERRGLEVAELFLFPNLKGSTLNTLFLLLVGLGSVMSTDRAPQFETEFSVSLNVEVKNRYLMSFRVANYEPAKEEQTEEPSEEGMSSPFFDPAGLDLDGVSAEPRSEWNSDILFLEEHVGSSPSFWNEHEEVRDYTVDMTMENILFFAVFLAVVIDVAHSIIRKRRCLSENS